MALMPNLLTALRARVMQDVLTLSQRYEPLSSAFWEQLGMPARAAAVAAGGAPALPRPPRERTALPQPRRYEIESVLETEHLRGGWWVRVRWAGYDPSWELVALLGSGGVADRDVGAATSRVPDAGVARLAGGGDAGVGDECTSTCSALVVKRKVGRPRGVSDCIQLRSQVKELTEELSAVRASIQNQV